MASNGEYPDGDIRNHRRSFTVPGGFNRTTDPPCPVQDAVTDVFVYREGQYGQPIGYIVVKRLETKDGDAFWSVEEHRYNGDYHSKWNSYGTASKTDVPTHIETAARNIKSHTYDE